MCIWPSASQDAPREVQRCVCGKENDRFVRMPDGAKVHIIYCSGGYDCQENLACAIFPARCNLLKARNILNYSGNELEGGRILSHWSTTRSLAGAWLDIDLMIFLFGK